MQVSMFHNPRCSKSRETLKLLNEKGIQPEIRLYLETPPTETQLSDVLKKLNMPPKHLIRFKEAVAAELGLSLADERPDAEWIRIMAEHPKLIERPIVIAGEKAVIGRPPEKVLSLLP
ncbi:MAG: arsenate reductase (glutaredoxin) [Nitrospiria bacterium]